MSKKVFSELKSAIELVDLNLPSGTLWSNNNEEGEFYTFDEAVTKFAGKLPTIEQFEELKSLCQWEWLENGYKVTGPNGKFIFLPAKGCRNGNGDIFGVDSCGIYWSSTPCGFQKSSELYIDSNKVGIGKNEHHYGLSVRLIANKKTKARKAEENSTTEIFFERAETNEDIKINKTNSRQYVNLGLPSGTRWKKSNEAGGLYNFDQAITEFGNALPTIEQFEELQNLCQWEWDYSRHSYKVTGPNGKSIRLSAEGLNGHNKGEFGGYWLALNDNDLEYVPILKDYVRPRRRLAFTFKGYGGAIVRNVDRTFRISVRLVRITKNK